MDKLFLAEFAFIVATMGLLASIWKMTDNKSNVAVQYLKISTGLVGFLFFIASGMWLYQIAHFSTMFNIEHGHYLLYYLVALAGVGSSSLVLLFLPQS